MRDLATIPRSEVDAEQDKLKQLVSDVLAEAKKLGASSAEASVNLDSGFSVSVRKGEVETVEQQRDRGLGITVYFGQRKAHASSADFSTAAMRETVAAAVSRARFTAEDDCSGLAEADRMATEFPDLDLWHPWDLSPEQAISLATQTEAAAFAAESGITNSEGATVNSGAGIRVYGNSHGFIGASGGTSHSLSCSVIAGEGDGMQRDYWYSYGRDAALLDSAEAVGAKAAGRAVSRLNSRQIKTTSAPVLFAPELARSLFGSFLGAISGGAQYRKSTFLLDSMGDKVFADHIQLNENPRLPGAVSSANYDSEGVATQNHQWVKDGVVQGYLLSSYSARKLGRETSGNAGGIFNLEVSQNGGDQAALLKEMGTGLLVTEMMGSGVNGVTGDYSRGAAGFWVENGEIAFPVHEVTVAGNLKEIYKSIVKIGSDVDRRGNIRCGSALVEQMTIAGSD